MHASRMMAIDSNRCGCFIESKMCVCFHKTPKNRGKSFGTHTLRIPLYTCIDQPLPTPPSNRERAEHGGHALQGCRSRRTLAPEISRFASAQTGLSWQKIDNERERARRLFPLLSPPPLSCSSHVRAAKYGGSDSQCGRSHLQPCCAHFLWSTRQLCAETCGEWSVNVRGTRGETPRRNTCRFTWCLTKSPGKTFRPIYPAMIGWPPCYPFHPRGRVLSEK